MEHQDHLIVSGYFSGLLDSELVNAQGGYDAFVASYRISDGEFVASQRWEVQEMIVRIELDVWGQIIWLRLGPFKEC